MKDNQDTQMMPGYTAYRNKLKECFEPGKEVEIQYFELKKSYGDW